MTTQIEVINQEVNTELGNEKAVKALLATTFKGFDVVKMKQALVEGRIRGFSFQDFLEKNVYAVPFSNGYSLITSIDYARKVGMRSGIVGKSAPVFTEKDNKIVSCSVTVQRKIGDHVGDYTATVYFDEYNTSKNLWTSKPRTMIAKVAEMHALRMACPEEMSQVYVEEEMQQTAKVLPVVDIDSNRAKLEACKNEEELRKVWSALPPEAKQALSELKDQLKASFVTEPVVVPAEVKGPAKKATKTK